MHMTRAYHGRNPRHLLSLYDLFYCQYSAYTAVDWQKCHSA